MATVKIKFNANGARTLKYVFEHGREGDPVDGEYCTPEPKTVWQQFEAIREAYGAKDGNEVAHVIQSWSPDESKRLTPAGINEMGRELASRYFPGHQFVVVTHTDRDHIHNHIVVNTVNVEDGRRLHNKFRHLHELRSINDEISRARGLSVPNPDAREREMRTPDKVQRMVRFHRFSYIMDMGQKADFARSFATSYDEYVGILDEMGVSARVEEKNITYFYPGQARGKRGKNLGRLYDKPGLEEAFKTNDERFQREPGVRALVRGQIDALKSDPGILQRPPKDYAKFTHVPRRSTPDGPAPARDLSHSLIPIDEINRARRGNIFDYCRRKGIRVAELPDGTRRLKDREHVVISDFEWMNTKNQTKGSLIDFVAMHRNMTYVQAIAHINGNPRLLLLEQHFGEQKRSFNSFYVPKDGQARRGEALSRLAHFLESRRIKPEHAESLLKAQQGQVYTSGAIHFRAKDDDEGALEFYRDGDGPWQRRLDRPPRGRGPSISF